MLSFLQGGFGDTPVCPCGDHWPGFSCPLGEPRDWFCRFSRRSPNLGGLSHAGKLITSRFIQSEFATGDRLCRREDVAKATCPGKSRSDRGRREHEGLWEAVCGHRGSSEDGSSGQKTVWCCYGGFTANDTPSVLHRRSPQQACHEGASPHYLLPRSGKSELLNWIINQLCYQFLLYQ